MHTESVRIRTDPDGSRPAPFRAGRYCGFLVALPTLALLATAAMHLRVSYAPCSVKTSTGYPCPTCGMTTAFRAMTRGRVIEAFRAHPFGPPLFAGVAVLAAAAAGQAVTGRGLLVKLRFGIWWPVAAIWGLLLGWGVKLVGGILTHAYPLG